MMKDNIKSVSVGYSYLRFSRPEQASGDSVRRQRAKLDDWLARNPHVKLDDGLTYHDKGTSGFTGKHRENPDRNALALFLQHVEKGRVAKGSFLIVESLDRLSREHVQPALSLVLNLLEAGIRIVQLSPVEMQYDRKSEAMHLMMALIELSRGHSESVIKSERCGAAWEAKKRQAAIDLKPITAVIPCWLERVDSPDKGNGGRFVVREDAARTVRRIFRLAREGVGIKQIVKTLTADATPTITGVRGKNRGHHWSVTFVKQLLNMPQTYGVYQPMRGKNIRVIDGDPIPNYFPAVVTQDEFKATRAEMAARRTARGRPTTGDVNLFKNILVDAKTRTRMNYMSKQGRPPVYYPNAWRRGEADFDSFPVRILENAVLSKLVEIDPAEILPPPDAELKEADKLAGEVTFLTAKIERLKAKLTEDDQGDESDDQLADVLNTLGKKLRVRTERLVELRQAAASPVAGAWKDCRTLISTLNAAPDRQAARTRLRQLIKRIVAEVWVCVRRRGHCQRVDVLVDLLFTGGLIRTYTIGWNPPTAIKPENWTCLAFDRRDEGTMRDDPKIAQFWLNPKGTPAAC